MSFEPAIDAGGSWPPAGREQLAGWLEAHPFLRGLTREQVATLAEYATATQFAAGNLIFREGDPANCFYLILDGCVCVEANLDCGFSQIIDHLGTGEVLGWSWMFPPFRWRFAARALTPTKAIFVYGTWLRERCDADPALGYELTKRMAAVAIGRLQSVRSKLAGAASASRRA